MSGGIDLAGVAAVAAATAVLVAASALGLAGRSPARPLPDPSGVDPSSRASSARSRASGSRSGTEPPRRSLVVGVVMLVVVVAFAVGPVVAVGGAAAVGVLRLRAARRLFRRRQRAVESCVPDLVDLFVIAAAAGHPVHACLAMVAERAPDAIRPALADARTSVERGLPLAAALQALGPRLGVLGPTLTGALATSAATGAPLGPALRDVAALARDRRRREAENEARRLPVTLLFPLVCCVLPAFVLLAVVPLLAASLAALEI